MKKKPSYYAKDILSTYDYIFDQLFLSEIERRILLNGFDPAGEKFGEPPEDMNEYYHYLEKCVEYLQNMKAANKPVVDLVIQTCLKDWPALNPRLHLLGMTKEQLFVLDYRIGEARSKLIEGKYPRKEMPKELDKDLDWFFPLVCLKTLLDT